MFISLLGCSSAGSSELISNELFYILDIVTIIGQNTAHTEVCTVLAIEILKHHVHVQLSNK